MLFQELDREHTGVLAVQLVSEGIINSGLDLEDVAVNSLLMDAGDATAYSCNPC